MTGKPPLNEQEFRAAFDAAVARRFPPDRDPDWRLSPPPHPGFAPFLRGLSVVVCHNCGAMVPDAHEWVQLHIDHEGKQP